MSLSGLDVEKKRGEDVPRMTKRCRSDGSWLANFLKMQLFQWGIDGAGQYQVFIDVTTPCEVFFCEKRRHFLERTLILVFFDVFSVLSTRAYKNQENPPKTL